MVIKNCSSCKGYFRAFYCVLTSDFGGQSVRTSDWIIANTNQYGVYRVNYTQDNWNKLINQLKQNHSVSYRGTSTVDCSKEDGWSGCLF